MESINTLNDLIDVYLRYAKGTLTDIDKNNFDILSETMFSHLDSQTNEKLKINELVYTFINNNIANVIYRIIKLDNGYQAGLFQTNIKRIENCINYKILNDEKIHLQLFKIFIGLTHEKSQLECQKEMIKYIVLYTNDINVSHLNNLFSIAIKYKQYGIIDKLKYHVEIEKFIDKNKLEIHKQKNTNQNKNVNLNVILQAKGQKLIDLLNEYNCDI